MWSTTPTLCTCYHWPVVTHPHMQPMCQWQIDTGQDLCQGSTGLNCHIVITKWGLDTPGRWTHPTTPTPSGILLAYIPPLVSPIHKIKKQLWTKKIWHPILICYGRDMNNTKQNKDNVFTLCHHTLEAILVVSTLGEAIKARDEYKEVYPESVLFIMPGVQLTHL